MVLLTFLKKFGSLSIPLVLQLGRLFFFYFLTILVLYSILYVVYCASDLLLLQCIFNTVVRTIVHTTACPMRSCGSSQVLEVVSDQNNHVVT